MSNRNQPPYNTPVNWRVNDFCRAYGIGRTRFYAFVLAGDIKPIKVGKQTLIPHTEAEKFQTKLLVGETTLQLNQHTK